MRNKHNVLFILAVFFSGILLTCPAGDAQMNAVNVQVLKADYSGVWDGLVDILRSSGEKISVQKKDKGIIKTGYRVIKPPEMRDNVNIPLRGYSGGFQRSWLWARYRSEFTVEKLNDQETKVKIMIRYEGWNASAGRYVRVISNGEKEKAILRSLEDSING